MSTREKKEQIVSNLKSRIEGASIAIVADYQGLSMEQMKECKHMVKDVADCVVVKNTLAKIALKNSEFEPMSGFFAGPSLLILGKDEPSEALKTLGKFQKKVGLLPLKGGVFPNEQDTLSPEQLDAIGKLPSKEAIMGQIAGMLVSTPTAIVNTINSTISDIGDLTVQVAEKNNS